MVPFVNQKDEGCFTLKKAVCPFIAYNPALYKENDCVNQVAAVGVVNGIINAHSSGNKLRGTVFPDKPDLFLSG